ncbi:hypothetical protein [Flavobacterium psychrotrophum]|uniref:hypothetical protein n=1 Tax=Flavobacterium psychrotrophum TaxID=2294119 RepID=UPI0013C518CE|nr:hypothetical protein [Flavobacterium psychrotrophum]
MKTSGSKRAYVGSFDYSDERHLFKNVDLETLPSHEAIKSSGKFYNGKINYGLLVRFLRGHIGRDWNEVHQEIISRIPTKLLDYKEMIYWFVADQVEYLNGKAWDKREQKFLRTEVAQSFEYVSKEFYVDPDTNTLKESISK